MFCVNARAGKLRKYLSFPMDRATDNIAGRPRPQTQVRMKPEELVHRVRANVFARDAEWRIEGDRLIWRSAEKEAKGDGGVIALDQVESIRLTQEPARRGMRLFCRVRTREGATALIGSAHHAGFLRAEDRGGTYRPLARGLISRVAIANPRARFLTGATPFAWWSVVLGLAVLFGAMAALFVLAGREMFTPRLLVGAALVAAGAPNLVRWLTANRPGAFDPADPPL